MAKRSNMKGKIKNERSKDLLDANVYVSYFSKNAYNFMQVQLLKSYTFWLQHGLEFHVKYSQTDYSQN